MHYGILKKEIRNSKYGSNYCRIRLGDFSPALSQEPYVSLSRHTAQIDIYLK